MFRDYFPNGKSFTPGIESLIPSSPPMGNPLIGASGIISTVRLITAFEMSEGSFMYRKTAPADNPADIRKLRIARVSINFLKVLFLLAVRRMRIELD